MEEAMKQASVSEPAFDYDHHAAGATTQEISHR
jgi:hypothetical protein